MKTVVSGYLLMLVALLGLSPAAWSQTDEDYAFSNYMRYENYIYRSSIRTVQVFKEGWENSQPVLQLGSQDRLTLSFDDFQLDAANYAYKLIHCDANWQPSQLNLLEYIEGMPDALINDYTFSRNTRQRYVHYEAVFPNDQFRILRSGNYILNVVDLDTEETVITWRFFVVDPKINVVMGVKQATQGRFRFTHHEVDFTLQQAGYELTNPYTDLNVVVLQNQRWDNAITNLKPLFVKDNELIYDYDDRNLFPGGNEFRQFDTRDLAYTALRTEQISLERDTFHVRIEKDEVRSIQVYLDQPDINGRFLIKRQDPRDISEIDSDYAWVQFRLPYPYPIKNGDLYLFGQLTNWNYEKRFKLHYNEEQRQYETAVYLKQGFYNYIYVKFRDGQKAGDVTFVEGSHAQTQNEYTVLVYHRQIGDIYDQLVSVTTVPFPVR